MHCAAEGGNLEALAFFLQVGVPVSVKKANGATPLFVAAQHCQAHTKGQAHNQADNVEE
jgi:hypothetical protein